jgi:formylglycine-generating enzyme required for sulfatase activity
MMEAPRRALSGIVLGLLIAFAAAAQDAAKVTAINAEIKKVEDKIKEESERVARKKENLQVEFAALNHAETKTALQTKLAEIGAKHRAELKPAGAPKDGHGAESRPKVPDAIRNAIQEECRAALAATVGRNLATVLDSQFATNLVILLREEAPVNYEALLTDTIGEIFTGTDFEANYRKLIPTFEKKLIDLNDELAGLKQRLADIDAEARARQQGLPPGMVLVPGGKYRIGMETPEFELAKKAARFDPKGGNISMYELGWPAHDVEIQDFFIDVNEVTNRYWAEFVKDTGRKPPKTWAPKPEKKEPAAVPNSGAQNAATRPSGADILVPAGMENLPVTSVTYEEVELYCQWCGRRPPTEFEWEAAARWRPAGDKSVRFWPWGDTYDLLKAQCNNATAAASPLRQGSKLTPVGSFPQGKSALGINDMGGNAAEWTSSYFNAYPNWKEDKAPSNKQGKDPFSGSIQVLRGGTALGDEMYTLTTTRKPMNAKSADLVGFRTAASKTRGKDFFDSVTSGNQLAAQLEQVGPPLKDEKSGRAELALADPSRYWAIQAGGWDFERQVPARAQFIAMICRNTLEFADGTRIKSLAREHKKPLMLGYFNSAVDFTKPEIPKGAYWVMWDPGRSKGEGKNKIAVPEMLTFQSMTNRENVYDGPQVNPVFVAGSTEHTHFATEKSGSQLSIIMCFPVKDRKDGRCIIEIRLETAPEALKAFK